MAIFVDLLENYDKHVEDTQPWPHTYCLVLPSSCEGSVTNLIAFRSVDYQIPVQPERGEHLVALAKVQWSFVAEMREILLLKSGFPAPVGGKVYVVGANLSLS